MIGGDFLKQNADIRDFFFRSRCRLDYLLIWGHGLEYEVDILDMLMAESNFQPVMILRHRAKNVRSLVRAVYSHDYAPLKHLKNKTKYLMTTPNEVVFIFFLNEMPMEFATGEGQFRHLECAHLKEFKQQVRSRFNPVGNNGIGISDDHVIHASDNEAQTESMLKWLGVNESINLLKTNAFPFFKMRHHLQTPEVCQIKEIKLSDLSCKILEGKRWNFRTIEVPVAESPQCRMLAESSSRIYGEYLNTFRGTGLKDPYTVSKYEKLVENFNYLERPHDDKFVVVQELDGGKYRVMDGLHRASILTHQGASSVLSVVVE